MRIFADPPAVVLPNRQAETLRIIAKYFEKNGCAPSIREISLGLKLKSDNPRGFINPLIRKGFLKRATAEDGRPCTHNLRITELGEEWLAKNPEPASPQIDLPL